MTAPPLPPDLRARVLTEVKRAPSPTRAAVRRGAAVTVAVGFAILALVFVAIGGPDLTTRPPEFLTATLAGWIAVALLSTWRGFGRGRSMLGRSASGLVAVAIVTGPALLGCLLLGTSMWPGTVGYVATAPLHLKCFAATITMAIGPVLALALVRRGSDPVHPRASGAALGAAAGAWAGVMIDLHCPVSDTAHVAFAHVVPVLLLSIVGALIGRRVFGVLGTSG